MPCPHHNGTLRVEVTVPPCQVARMSRSLARMGLPVTEELLGWHFTLILNQLWDQACSSHDEGHCDPGGGPLAPDDEAPEY